MPSLATSIVPLSPVLRFLSCHVTIIRRWYFTGKPWRASVIFGQQTESVCISQVPLNYIAWFSIIFRILLLHPAPSPPSKSRTISVKPRSKPGLGRGWLPVSAIKCMNIGNLIKRSHILSIFIERWTLGIEANLVTRKYQTTTTHGSWNKEYPLSSIVEDFSP